MESRMQVTAASEGIQIVYEGFTSNTMPAHRLITWAKASGKQDTLVTKIFEQYFGNGKAPCDTEMLAEAAAQAGLDKAEAEAFLESDDLKADVATEAERVKRSFGVSGVPFFVVHADGSPDLPIGVSGAQEPETLVQVVSLLLRRLSAQLVPLLHVLCNCTLGGDAAAPRLYLLSRSQDDIEPCRDCFP